VLVPLSSAGAVVAPSAAEDDSPGIVGSELEPGIVGSTPVLPLPALVPVPAPSPVPSSSPPHATNDAQLATIATQCSLVMNQV
jgi:hypothetical protein